MLDGFIIEELKRREEQERRRRSERPVLELPLDDHAPSRGDSPRDDDEDDEADKNGQRRGVIIIDI